MANLTNLSCYVRFVGSKLINESRIYTRSGRSGLKNKLIEYADRVS